MAFVIQCPHCDARLKATERMVGKAIPCPMCDTPVRVRSQPVSSEMPSQRPRQRRREPAEREQHTENNSAAARWMIVAGVVVGVLLLAAVTAPGINRLLSSDPADEETASAEAPTEAAGEQTDVAADVESDAPPRTDEAAQPSTDADDTLERLKAATVFIKVNTTEGVQTGSGFLLERKQGGGVIVTNAHVVTPEAGTLRGVQCVFNSGRRSEFSVGARIKGRDEGLDLAVLAVRHHNLPRPLESQQKVALRETLGVLVLGFPFGEALTTNNRNPAITVSRGAISSIRRDVYDNTVLLQIDGGINPGNSGGPMVTEDGRLVGISVAKVRDADIGFAIPAAALSEVLLGRAAGIRTTVRPERSGERECEILVEFVDPNDNVQAARVLVFRADRQTRKQPDAAGRWDQASDAATITPLKMNGHEGQARFRLGPSTHRFQVSWTRKDGSRHFTAPTEFEDQPRVAGRPEPPERPIAGGMPQNPAPRVGNGSRSRIVRLPGAFVDIAIGGGGRFLILNLQSLKKLAVFDTVEQKVVKYINTGSFAICTAGMEKLVVALPTQRIIQRWDLGTFERELTVALSTEYDPSTVAMGSASAGPVLVCGGSDRSHQYQLLDLTSLKPIQFERQRHGRFAPNMHCRVRASANGSVFTAYRLTTSPSGFMVLLTDGERVDNFYAHDSLGYLAPSADGTRIYTSQGIYTHETKPVGPNLALRSGSFPIPAVQGTFYVRVERVDQNAANRNRRPAVSFHISGHDGALFTLPDVDVRGGTYSDFHSREPITLDKRVYLVPAANALITIPVSNDSLSVRELNLDEELDRTGIDYLFVLSSAPSTVVAGEIFDYKIVVRSKRGNVRFDLASGPDGMTITPDGRLQWTPSVDDVDTHDVIVSVGDASAQEVFHTFKLRVVASP